MPEFDTVVIWNPNARSGDELFPLRADLAGRPGVKLITPSTSDEAQAATQQAADAGARLLIAAGGDGTINAIINALPIWPDHMAMAILPVGTGNDLCRSLEIPLDPLEATGLLWNPIIRRIDLVRAETPNYCRLHANMATGGNTDEVVQNLNDEQKRTWGALCYLPAALGKLTDLTGFDLQIQYDDQPPQQLRAWNVMIGNGRTSAGGVQVAPRADLEDGLLEVVVVLEGSALDIASLAAEYLMGDYLEHERVSYRRARRVRIQSQPPMHFSLDGEVIPEQPVTFTVQPQALPVVVGPRYRSEAKVGPAALARVTPPAFVQTQAGG